MRGGLDNEQIWMSGETNDSSSFLISFLYRLFI